MRVELIHSSGPCTYMDPQPSFKLQDRMERRRGIAGELTQGLPVPAWLRGSERKTKRRETRDNAVEAGIAMAALFGQLAAGFYYWLARQNQRLR